MSKEITLPNFNKIADSLLDYNSWNSIEPLANRLARALEECYNQGKARGKIEEIDRLYVKCYEHE